jgi:hypothetical protein
VEAEPTIRRGPESVIDLEVLTISGNHSIGA